jgi:hypothetical protein
MCGSANSVTNATYMCVKLQLLQAIWNQHDCDGTSLTGTGTSNMTVLDCSGIIDGVCFNSQRLTSVCMFHDWRVTCRVQAHCALQQQRRSQGSMMG